MSERPKSDTLAALGEAAVVASITGLLPQGAGVLLGPGDDAAVVQTADGRAVVSTDVLVEGVHFRQDWASPTDIGARAAAASLADIAAMGARATALVVGVAAPEHTEQATLLRLAEGLRDEASSVGASVVGGDVTSGPLLMICVTAIGDLQGRPPVTRSGARPEDVVAVCGRLGWAAAGLAVLRRGFRMPRAVVDAYRRPQPPYAAGPAAAAASATAMCDVSDGLLLDAGRVAAASEVVIDIASTALRVDEPVASVAAAHARPALEWVLTGGDDHPLLATFGGDTDLPDGFSAVGRVVAPSEGAAPSVLVDGQPWSGHPGHLHFGWNVGGR